jgi:hypothetical protein
MENLLTIRISKLGLFRDLLSLVSVKCVQDVIKLTLWTPHECHSYVRPLTLEFSVALPLIYIHCQAKINMPDRYHAIPSLNSNGSSSDAKHLTSLSSHLSLSRSPNSPRENAGQDDAPSHHVTIRTLSTSTAVSMVCLLPIVGIDLHTPLN